MFGGHTQFSLAHWYVTVQHRRLQSDIDPATDELDIGSWYVTYLPTQNSPKLDHYSKPILSYLLWERVHLQLFLPIRGESTLVTLPTLQYTYNSSDLLEVIVHL